MQTIARGPVATQEAIKLLSGDGGGFFNANSAHPFENPTPLTNFVEVLLIFGLGAALTNCFGRMVRSERQGWILLCVMAILFGLGVTGIYSMEADGNAALPALQVEQTPDTQPPHGTWKARRCALASPVLPCSLTFRPPPQTALSTACTTASCRSAAAFFSPT